VEGWADTTDGIKGLAASLYSASVDDLPLTIGLMAMGYPARAMRMAVVVNPEGEGHAVLVVRSSDGDFVLDNRTSTVLPWYAARYTWVKRESDDGSDSWVALGGIRSPVETADDTK